MAPKRTSSLPGMPNGRSRSTIRSGDPGTTSASSAVAAGAVAVTGSAESRPAQAAAVGASTGTAAAWSNPIASTSPVAFLASTRRPSGSYA